jgi:Holliday junction resolvase RusA-like endonuclease
VKGYVYKFGGVQLFLPCVPPKATHQAKKVARRGSFRNAPIYGITDKPELVATRQFLTGLLLGKSPARPIEGPVSLILEFEWPWLKGHGKRLRAAHTRIPCRSKPDCSNAAKTIEDVLVDLRFLVDDVDVVELTVRKWFGDRPGITVRISELEELPASQPALTPPIGG